MSVENEFNKNDKKLLAYGYSPDFNLWIKFTLKNTTDKPINKILEYNNPLTTHIEFFNTSDKIIEKEGLYQTVENRATVNPTFNINLQAQESKTFYIKATSHITTLIVSLNLYDNESFYEKEIKHQLILGLFFASMLILGIYNLFIYFFTKDISYLHYVFYIFGIIAHQMIYVGMANVYLFNQAVKIMFVEYASLLVAFPIYFLALFTKSFLKTVQYPILNKILNILLIVTPISVVFFIAFDMFNKYRNIFYVMLFAYLIFITLYAALKKNRQAYFILFGWSIILMASTFMLLSSTGIFDIHEHLPYIVEIAFVLEAVIFSIALADRIKQLQKEKNDVNTKLIYQQQHEQEKLKLKVTEKTIDLKNTLDEKEILLKELNHRVKNNMQTIVSLIRLQIDEIDDVEIKNILSTTYNRVNAMSHLYEMLFVQKKISNVDATDYFTMLISEIQESYNQDIQIHLDITSELKLDQAVYCGLILNELITNSFKHAFTSSHGNIYIKLAKDKIKYLLSVSDDGVGYDKNVSSNSLGLVLINSLVKSKLYGTVDICSNNGVTTTIIWENKNA
jgi:two-component sensor histidine kinase